MIILLAASAQCVFNLDVDEYCINVVINIAQP